MSKSNEGQGILECGVVVGQRYRIEQRLGSGGMGNVYLVEDLNSDGQRLALKVLHKELLNDDKQRQRFLREVQLMRRIDQQNVVRVFDVGMEGELAFFTMEYVPGRQLEDFVQAHSFPLDKIGTLIIQICEGLEAVHRAGVIHRDLKPANIIVLSDGSAKITDFGVARPEYSNLTAHNEIVGSALYIAPEVWIGTRMTHSIDLYSLGVILFELTTGMLPFEGDSPAALMRLHMDQPPADPKSLNSAIPTWLNKLILRLLEKSEADRPRDAREVIEYVKLHTQSPKKAASPSGTTARSKAPSSSVELPSSESEGRWGTGGVATLAQPNDEQARGRGYHGPRRRTSGAEVGAPLAKRLALTVFVLMTFGLLPTMMLRLIVEIKPMVLANTPAGLSYLLLQGMVLPSSATTILWVTILFGIAVLFAILPSALIGAASGSLRLVVRTTARVAVGAIVIWCLLLLNDLDLSGASSIEEQLGSFSLYSSSILLREQLIQLAYFDPSITVIGHTVVEHGRFAEEVGHASIYSSVVFTLGYLFFALQVAGTVFRALGERMITFIATLLLAMGVSSLGILKSVDGDTLWSDTALNSPMFILCFWLILYLVVLATSIIRGWNPTTVH